jgi:molybdopterin synthase catalytic subunit
LLISVQQQDFDVTQVVQRLCKGRRDVGAIVSFTGLVRDVSADQDLVAMQLEHYPGMTENALSEIAQQAQQRWDIQDLAIIHRVGTLQVSDNIVLVVVISAHRREAFEACDFLMDYLKTQAPFWKKEITRDGESWVAAKQTDQADALRWSKKTSG